MHIMLYDIDQYVSNETHIDKETAHLAAGCLLAYTLLGLGSLFWAFWSQRSQLEKFKGCTSSRCGPNNLNLKGLENVHRGLVNILVLDIMIAAAAIFLAVQFIVSNDFFESTPFVYLTWFLLRYIGLVMHLLVALFSLHFLCNQHYGAEMSILYVVTVVSYMAVITLFVFFPLISTFGMAVLLFALALVIVVKRATLPFPLSANALKNQVVATSMLTFYLVFLPSFVTHCIYLVVPSHSTDLLFLNTLFGTNIHIFLDGLLCFFILRFPGGEQLNDDSSSSSA